MMLFGIEIPIFVQTIFVIFLMVAMFVFLFNKTVKRLDYTQFFTNEVTGKISHTKTWGNIAYLSATIMFIHLNLTNINDLDKLEVLWIIYLGIVASNAVASKFITSRNNNRS